MNFHALITVVAAAAAGLVVIGLAATQTVQTKKQASERTTIEAPFTSVETEDGKTRVRAPFVDIEEKDGG